MMNVCLFGTCTMKYHAARLRGTGARYSSEIHPLQPEDTLQGMLAVVHGFDLILCELSGMDQFIFQPGGGADAAYTHAVVTRAWLQSRGELGSATRSSPRFRPIHATPPPPPPPASRS